VLKATEGSVLAHLAQTAGFDLVDEAANVVPQQLIDCAHLPLLYIEGYKFQVLVDACDPSCHIRFQGVGQVVDGR
jgi:hypothetical protein